jgi:hypothetical protein
MKIRTCGNCGEMDQSQRFAQDTFSLIEACRPLLCMSGLLCKLILGDATSLQKTYSSIGQKSLLQYKPSAAFPKVAFSVCEYLHQENAQIMHLLPSLYSITKRSLLCIFTGSFHLHMEILNEWHLEACIQLLQTRPDLEGFVSCCTFTVMLKH